MRHADGQAHGWRKVFDALDKAPSESEEIEDRDGEEDEEDVENDEVGEEDGDTEEHETRTTATRRQ